MKFAKIIRDIGGTVVDVFSEKFVHDTDGRKIYVNPTGEQLKKCGYKEYIETDCVIEPKEGYSITEAYKEDDDTITVEWEYREEIEHELSATQENGSDERGKL